MLARGAAASAALVRGAPWALGAQRARPAGALTSCGAARAPHTALRAQSTLIARTAHVPVCMRGFAAQRSCLAAWLASGEAHTQATARRVARASRPHQRVCSSWAGDGAASTSPFKTTRLPSLQTHYRTVAGVEETTAIIEEVASQVQQFAPAAESIAGRLSPRTARELARALAADTGDAIARPPNGQTLFLLGLSSCVPFIGFGYAALGCTGPVPCGDVVRRCHAMADRATVRCMWHVMCVCACVLPVPRSWPGSLTTR